MAAANLRRRFSSPRQRSRDQEAEVAAQTEVGGREVETEADPQVEEAGLGLRVAVVDLQEVVLEAAEARPEVGDLAVVGDLEAVADLLGRGVGDQRREWLFGENVVGGGKEKEKEREEGGQKLPTTTVLNSHEQRDPMLNRYRTGTPNQPVLETLLEASPRIEAGLISARTPKGLLGGRTPKKKKSKTPKNSSPKNKRKSPTHKKSPKARAVGFYKMGDALGLAMEKPADGGGGSGSGAAEEEDTPFFDFSEQRIAESRERQRLKSGEAGEARAGGSPKKRVSFLQ